MHNVLLVVEQNSSSASHLKKSGLSNLEISSFMDIIRKMAGLLLFTFDPFCMSILIKLDFPSCDLFWSLLHISVHLHMGSKMELLMGQMTCPVALGPPTNSFMVNL